MSVESQSVSGVAREYERRECECGVCTRLAKSPTLLANYCSFRCLITTFRYNSAQCMSDICGALYTNDNNNEILEYSDGITNYPVGKWSGQS